MVRGQQNVSRVQRRAWHGALLAAILLSLLPSRWLVGWTSDLAQVVRFPLVPMQHAASGVQQWLRPMPDPKASKPEELRLLEVERDQLRKEVKRLEVEREGLLGRIALLEQTREAIRRANGSDSPRIVYAAVIGTQLPSGRSIGSLTVNAGSRNGVDPGMVAAWDGDIVVGRSAATLDRFTSTLIPVGSLSGFAVRFYPPDRTIPTSQAPGGVLKADGDNGWTVDLTQPGDIAEGWIACIADETWPRASLGMRVGVVESVGTRDDAPLVRRLRVHPLVDPYRVPRVMLVDDGEPDGGGGGTP